MSKIVNGGPIKHFLREQTGAGDANLFVKKNKIPYTLK